MIDPSMERMPGVEVFVSRSYDGKFFDAVDNRWKSFEENENDQLENIGLALEASKKPSGQPRYDFKHAVLSCIETFPEPGAATIRGGYVQFAIPTAEELEEREQAETSADLQQETQVQAQEGSTDRGFAQEEFEDQQEVPQHLSKKQSRIAKAGAIVILLFAVLKTSVRSR